MKLYRKDFCIFKDLVYIFPTIILAFNEQIYTERNFAIEFRWLVFHTRLLWLESKNKGDTE